MEQRAHRKVPALFLMVKLALSKTSHKRKQQDCCPFTRQSCMKNLTELGFEARAQESKTVLWREVLSVKQTAYL